MIVRTDVEPFVAMPWHRTAWLMLKTERLVMLVGEPGTGKTTWAREAAREITNAEAETLQGTPETDMSHIWGLYTLVSGETRFADGPLPRALRRGALLVVEELNLVPLEARAHLLGLRGHDTITNPITGETHEIPKGFRLVATSNPETLGCYRRGEVAQALYDGFVILEVPCLGREELAKLLDARHDLDPELRDRALDLWADYAELTHHENDKVKIRLGYRSVDQYVRLRRNGLEDRPAAEVSFVNKFITDDDAHSAAKLRASLQ